METDWEQHNIYTSPLIRCSLLRTEVIGLLTASLCCLLLFQTFYSEAVNWSNSKALCNLVPLIVKSITNKKFKGAYSNFFLRTSRCSVLQATVNLFMVRRPQIYSGAYFGIMSLFRKLCTAPPPQSIKLHARENPHIVIHKVNSYRLSKKLV
jgi:hypothetical protein